MKTFRIKHILKLITWYIYYRTIKGIAKCSLSKCQSNDSHITFNIWLANISNFVVGKSSLQEIVPLAILLEISDSNLETGRYGQKSGASQFILESWQHCVQSCSSFSLEIITYQVDICRQTHRNLGVILLVHWTTKLVLLLAQDQNLLALGSRTWVFSCPDHVLKGSSNNLEDIPGSIIYYYNQQRQQN